MEDIDLEIRNYELTDILNLFKIPLLFNEKHLKQAKITVLQMHPDKSHLPKEYFLFLQRRIKCYTRYTRCVIRMPKNIKKINFHTRR